MVSLSGSSCKHKDFRTVLGGRSEVFCLRKNIILRMRNIPKTSFGNSFCGKLGNCLCKMHFSFFKYRSLMYKINNLLIMFNVLLSLSRT